MESSSDEKQNESDECDDRSEKNEELGTESNSKNVSQTSLEKIENLENVINCQSKTTDSSAMVVESSNIERGLSQDDEPEEDEERNSDEAELHNNENKVEDESVTTSSSTSSDEESETSSDDKTEPSKADGAAQVVQIAESLRVEEQHVTKNDDTTDDSDIEDDLVSAINYNTITSLAALKDMLQSSGEDSEGVDSFFHHYFLSHVNRLPSRNQTHSPYPWGRRLSECREEDEYETEEGISERH